MNDVNKPIEINGTIILLEGDVLPFSEKPYNVFDFNITTDQRNNAHNIIFIDEKKVIHILKKKVGINIISSKTMY